MKKIYILLFLLLTAIHIYAYDWQKDGVAEVIEFEKRILDFGVNEELNIMRVLYDDHSIETIDLENGELIDTKNTENVNFISDDCLSYAVFTSTSSEYKITLYDFDSDSLIWSYSNYYRSNAAAWHMELDCFHINFSKKLGKLECYLEIDELAKYRSSHSGLNIFGEFQNDSIQIIDSIETKAISVHRNPSKSVLTIEKGGAASYDSPGSNNSTHHAWASLITFINENRPLNRTLIDFDIAEEYVNLTAAVSENKGIHYIYKGSSWINYFLDQDIFIDHDTSVYNPLFELEFMQSVGNNILLSANSNNLLLLNAYNGETLDSIPFKMLFDNFNQRAGFFLSDDLESVYVYKSDRSIAKVKLHKDNVGVIADFDLARYRYLQNDTVPMFSYSVGDIDSLVWDFGDGTIGYGEFPQHRYEKPGKYTISLKAYGKNASDSITKIDYLTILKPLKANFEYEVMNEVLPNQIKFKNTSVGDIDSLIWDMGDSSFRFESDFEQKYYFNKTYTVKLVVHSGIYTETAVKSISVNLPFTQKRDSLIQFEYFGDLVDATAHRAYSNENNDILASIIHPTNNKLTYTFPCQYQTSYLLAISSNKENIRLTTLPNYQNIIRKDYNHFYILAAKDSGDILSRYTFTNGLTDSSYTSYYKDYMLEGYHYEGDSLFVSMMLCNLHDFTLVDAYLTDSVIIKNQILNTYSYPGSYEMTPNFTCRVPSVDSTLFYSKAGAYYRDYSDGQYKPKIHEWTNLADAENANLISLERLGNTVLGFSVDKAIYTFDLSGQKTGRIAYPEYTFVNTTVVEDSIFAVGRKGVNPVMLVLNSNGEIIREVVLGHIYGAFEGTSRNANGNILLCGHYYKSLDSIAPYIVEIGTSPRSNIIKSDITIKDVSFYSNPAGDTPKLKFRLNAESKVSVTIFDMLGAKTSLVFSGSLNSGENILDLDLSELAKGAYFYKIKAGDSEYTDKFIKN